MKKVRLGDYISLVGGGTPSKAVEHYWDGDIPWASVKDLKSDYIGETEDYITYQGLENSSTRIIPANSLIIATRMAVGKTAFNTVDMAINQDLKAIFCSEELSVKYLFYLLKAKTTYFSRVSSGATVKGIKINHIADIKIPLPPISEQKKIAAILDAADAYRQKTKALIEKYNALSQSLFLEMFGDPVSNPMGWEKVTIRDLVNEVKYGTSSKAVEGGKHSYLRMNNITYLGHMDYSKLKYIDLSDKDLLKYSTRKGDILFNRTNSKELVGKTGIIKTDEVMVLAGYLIRVRVKDDVNPFYVWGHLNSKWAKLTLQSMCKSIVGMANINAQELQDIAILKPPTILQNQFAQRIEAIEQQKAQAEASLAKAEDLFGSLLQGAFRGEL